jgi:hypothetical protein
LQLSYLFDYVNDWAIKQGMRVNVCLLFNAASDFIVSGRPVEDSN